MSNRPERGRCTRRAGLRDTPFGAESRSVAVGLRLAFVSGEESEAERPRQVMTSPNFLLHVQKERAVEWERWESSPFGILCSKCSLRSDTIAQEPQRSDRSPVQCGRRHQQLAAAFIRPCAPGGPPTPADLSAGLELLFTKSRAVPSKHRDAKTVFRAQDGHGLGAPPAPGAWV